MGAAYVRSASNASGTTAAGSIGQVFPAPVAAGNRLLAFVDWGALSTSGVTVTLSDSVNGSAGWARLAASNTSDDPGPQTGEVWELKSTLAGTPTVTATFSANQTFCGLVIVEVSGADSSVAANVATARPQVSVTPFTTANVTPSVAGCYVAAFCTNDVDSVQPTAGGAYTLRQATGAGSTQVAAFEDQVQGASAPIAANFAFAAAKSGTVHLVAIAPLLSVGTGTPPTRLRPGRRGPQSRRGPVLNSTRNAAYLVFSSTSTGDSVAPVPITGASDASALAFAASVVAMLLAGSATASAAAVGTSSLAIPIGGSATAVAPAVGSSTQALPLSGSATANAPASAASSVATPLAGAATVSILVQGASIATVPISGAAAASLLAAGSSSAALPLSGAAAGAVLAQAGSVVPLPLSGVTTGLIGTVSVADSLIALPFSGSLAATGLASGASTKALPMSGAMAATAPASGSSTVLLALTSSAAASALGQGASLVALPITGVANGTVGTLVVTGVSTVAVPLSGAITARVAIVGASTIAIPLGGTASGVHVVPHSVAYVGTITARARLVGTVASRSRLSGTVTTRARLTSATVTSRARSVGVVTLRVRLTGTITIRPES